MESSTLRFSPGAGAIEGSDQPQTIQFRVPAAATHAQPAATPVQDNTPLIFSVAAGLMGVSLSGIGLFAILSHMRSAATLGEESLAFNASIFGASCVTAYLSMKTGNAARKRRLRQFAEGLFLFGLVLMAAVCVFLAVTLHQSPPGGSDGFSGSGPTGSAAAGHVAHVGSPVAESSGQQ